MEQSKLATAAYIAVIIAAAIYSFDTANEAVEGFHAAGRQLEVKISAQTNVEAAHVVMTNVNRMTVVSKCFKAVVTRTKDKKTVESVAICTGEMKPRTTVTMAAPYAAGSVLELCGVDGQYGQRHPDWSLCEFDLAPVDG